MGVVVLGRLGSGRPARRAPSQRPSGPSSSPRDVPSRGPLRGGPAEVACLAVVGGLLLEGACLGVRRAGGDPPEAEFFFFQKGA